MRKKGRQPERRTRNYGDVSLLEQIGAEIAVGFDAVQLRTQKSSGSGVSLSHCLISISAPRSIANRRPPNAR
jgi:hypothetical protein